MSQILQTRAAYACHPAHKNHSSLLKRTWIQHNNNSNDDEDDNNNNNNNNVRQSIFTTKEVVNSFQAGQCCVDASSLKRINKV
jgi:hypothetical protein